MKWEYIVIHHSLTRDGQSVNWSAITKYHTETLGWRDNGYHFGVELIYKNYEVLVGRGMDQRGAHTKQAGMNGNGLGICIVGNFDHIGPPPEAWEAAVSLTRSLMNTFFIPKSRVIGHREAGLMDGLDWENGSFKTCPGRLFNMDDFRQDL